MFESRWQGSRYRQGAALPVGSGAASLMASGAAVLVGRTRGLYAQGGS